MALPDPSFWPDLQRRTLASYDEALLRGVAGKLVRPRSQWSAEELVERAVEASANPASLDRRLKDLEPAGRQLLALVGHSRQPLWALGNLVEMLLALGHADGLQPIFALFEAGLLYPYLGPTVGPERLRIKGFEQWLASPGPEGLQVFTLPLVAARARGEELPLPDLAAGPASALPLAVQEADGLEMLLRVAVLWQQVWGAPLRRTQQGGFFKRDADRLAQDPLLNAATPDTGTTLPDAGYLVAALAELGGVLRDADGELRVGILPPAWEQGLAPALEELWVDLFRVRAWNPQDGWRGGDVPAGNPFASAYLLSLLLLARLPEGAWASPLDLEEWLHLHHPFWNVESLRPSRQQPWLPTFLLGIAYPLRLVQAARAADGDYQVRLSASGRWLLGLAAEPPQETLYTQTLLVQPNLEVIAYRQGLTAALLARLTRFAAWKNVGPACTLQLGPDSVYRALESGDSYESIRMTLEQHGTRAVPPAVLDSLRTWSNKRDRITVYPSAALLEFASPGDLDEALARGLPAVRIAPTLAVVPSESDIDYRHFRLTGTRDYAGLPEKCVAVEADGVTLTVDLARSDLLLETELPRFAEPIDRPPAAVRRQYRLTPASLAAARASGLGVTALESWFQQRTGGSLPPAARLLLAGSLAGPARLRHHLVLHVATPDQADGLLQWPATRSLIAARLGPTTLAIDEEHADLLRTRLGEAGLSLTE